MSFVSCFVAAALLFVSEVAAGAVVETPLGRIEGALRMSRGGRAFNAFSRIPYAKPPVGRLRFKNPEPAEPWEGIKDGMVPDSPMCTQINVYFPFLKDIIMGQEDCLYLSVFTPKIDKDAKMPVLVYIHGGGFRCGFSGSAKKAEFFMDQDVVLVFINYRLGIQGFLSTEDEVIPGNFGLKDQSIALKWIKENINVFGGDPETVAIFGESAGGASVHFHMMSPLSKGLFSKGISQSGAATALWAWAEPGSARSKAYKVAEALNCPLQPHTELLNCLLTKESKEITKTEQIFDVISGDPAIVFQPVIETESPSAFLTKSPLTIKTTLPWITGCSSREGAFKEAMLRQGDQKEIDQFYKTLMEFTSVMLLYDNRTENEAEVTKKIIDHYFKSQTILDGTVEIMGDMFFAWPMEVGLRNHEGPAYVYYYDHRGEVSMTDLVSFKKDLGDLGVAHTDELLALFNYKEIMPKIKGTAADRTVSEKLIQLWVNFAKYGNPTPPGNEVTWNKYSKGREQLHMKTNEFAMDKSMNEDVIRFFDSLPFKGYGNTKSVKDEL